MSQKKIKTNKEIKETDIMDIILNNNSEDFQNIQSHTIKAVNMKKIKFFKNYVQMDEDEENSFYNKLKRSNSVDLYKKHKEKQLKKQKENNNDNNNKIEPMTEEKKINKNDNNKNGKKVTFLKTNFVTIIDVESYKKFNQENTSKDPYDELVNNNNNINNNKDDNEKNDNGKEKVVCSCFIY